MDGISRGRSGATARVESAGSRPPGRGFASSRSAVTASPRWLMRAAGAGFRRGGEEDLELGVRKHDGTDVPPVDYHVAAGPHHSPKPGVDPFPDHRDRGHRGDASGHLRTPDLGVHRLPLQVGRESGAIRLEHEAAVFRRPEDCLCADDLERVVTRPAAASGLAHPHHVTPR